MANSPRVRFSPAPTGFLHVGSARTALFNWLYARHTGGTFVLRIEDTDPERSRPELIAPIEAALRWLGLDMAISHVIRGEDLLPSTPRVLLIRHALGRATDPVYAHLPMIVNEKRQKLSKRRDDVAVEEYRERGYLPEAMRNYLALLGWS